MVYRVKPEPDQANDSPSLERYPRFQRPPQSLDQEAKRPWFEEGDPTLSPRLVDAIHAELHSPPSVKFIDDINSTSNYVTLKCALHLANGSIAKLDAGRIALFRLINAVIINSEFWNSPEHYAVVDAYSVQRAQRYGIDTGKLVEYFTFRTTNYNHERSQALLPLLTWSGISADSLARAPALVSAAASSTYETPSARWSASPDASSSEAFENLRALSDQPEDVPANQTYSSASIHTDLFSDATECRDVPQTLDNASESPKTNFQLQRLLNDQPLQILEKGVEAGIRLLDQIKGQFRDREEASHEVPMWLERIAKIQKQAVKTRTVVGVVGNTGAGKSSVINALLDEERLVPTNCMRACTAVITEISYNDTEVPYRAEIEFIDCADWKRELDILFQDMIDGSGHISRESTLNEDSDAGVAYAKIKAVYPRLTKEAIEASDPDALLRHENARVLGSTIRFAESSSLSFYRRLQGLIDSKEKIDQSEDKQGKRKRPKEPAYWPLIKTVKIYVRSPALETGAVIVDLPGVHDSNAARAKVADNYMKQCTGLWIVAPINRAVDDKAAKTLLGETFKRQLKMDGGFSTVTFICSKTDDISVMEATDSLGLEEQFGEYEATIAAHSSELKKAKKEVKDLEQEKADVGDKLEATLEQAEVWEACKDDLESGKQAFAPSFKKGSKRRRVSSTQAAVKRLRRTQSSSGSSDCSSSEYESDESDDESLEQPEERVPLTIEHVNREIDHLKKIRRESRDRKISIADKIKPLKRHIQAIELQLDSIETEKRSRCITGRNRYSQQAIKSDYASGIRELDEEIAEEEDAANFDPDEERRDYDEVARQLPVFCVSSRAYHKLQGRFRQESDVPGFKTAEDTQIPQLQDHCRELTIKGRTNACNHFLSTLSQLLNSLSIWASNDGTGSALSADHRSRETTNMQQRIRKLGYDIDKLVENLALELRTAIADQIYDRFEMAISAASQAAVPSALRWGLPVNRDNPAAGGIHHSTYGAICRRNGVYTNKRGTFDWNGELIEPVIKNVVPGWERTFQRRVPGVLKGFVRDASNTIRSFHADACSRARNTGTAGTGLYLLEEQVKVHEQELKRISDQALEAINTRQKEINREFRPVVETGMYPVYEQCSLDRGPGVTARRKGYMQHHVDEHKDALFRQSTGAVKDALDVLVRDSRRIIEAQVDENVLASLQRDYMSAFGWNANVQLLPKPERALRAEVQHRVQTAEAVYQRVVNADYHVQNALEASPSDEKPAAVVLAADPETGDNPDQATELVAEMDAHAPEDVDHKTGSVEPAFPTVDNASSAEPSLPERDTRADYPSTGDPIFSKLATMSATPSVEPEDIDDALQGSVSKKRSRDSGIGIREDPDSKSPGDSPPPRRAFPDSADDRVLCATSPSTINKPRSPTNNKDDENGETKLLGGGNSSSRLHAVPDYDTLTRRP